MCVRTGRRNGVDPCVRSFSFSIEYARGIQCTCKLASALHSRVFVLTIIVAPFAITHSQAWSARYRAQSESPAWRPSGQGGCSDCRAWQARMLESNGHQERRRKWKPSQHDGGQRERSFCACCSHCSIARQQRISDGAHKSTGLRASCPCEICRRMLTTLRAA